jgi:hypothetical protein
VDDSVDLNYVTHTLCTKYLSHQTLALPTTNLLRVVVARRARQNRLPECKELSEVTNSAIVKAVARAPTPHHLIQQLAAITALFCEDGMTAGAAEALKGLLVAATRGSSISEDHELCNAIGSIAQVVCAIATLPSGLPAVEILQARGVVLIPFRRDFILVYTCPVMLSKPVP